MRALIRTSYSLFLITGDAHNARPSAAARDMVRFVHF